MNNIITQINNEKIWIDDPSILYNNYLAFFPEPNMTRIEQLNAVTRLALYSFILIFIFYGQSSWLYVPVIIIIFILVLYYIYEMDPKGKEKELYRLKGYKYEGYKNIDSNKKIRLESGYYDSNNKLHLGEEYTVNSEDTNKIEYNIDEMNEYNKATCRKPTRDNPFMNAAVTEYNQNKEIPVACNVEDDDIKDNMDKTFNTGLYRDIEDLYDVKNSQRMYYTVPEHDQDKFAKWLYGNTDNCKTNQEKCLINQDIRYNQDNFR